MRYLILRRADKWNIASPASRWFDRVIRFRKGEEFAIVCSMFYGRKESKHRTAEAVIKKHEELLKQGYPMHSIFHVSGAVLVVKNNTLVRV